MRRIGCETYQEREAGRLLREPQGFDGSELSEKILYFFLCGIFDDVADVHAAAFIG